MNRRAAVLSTVIGGVVGLTAFGAVAFGWAGDSGTSAPTEPSTTVEAPASSTTSSIAATTTTDATPATIVVRVPVSSPDTSGDLTDRVTKVEQRVSTIESTLAEQPPTQVQPSPPVVYTVPHTVPQTPPPHPDPCGGRGIDGTTGNCKP